MTILIANQIHIREGALAYAPLHRHMVVGQVKCACAYYTAPQKANQARNKRGTSVDSKPHLSALCGRSEASAILGRVLLTRGLMRARRFRARNTPLEGEVLKAPELQLSRADGAPSS